MVQALREKGKKYEDILLLRHFKVFKKGKKVVSFESKR